MFGAADSKHIQQESIAACRAHLEVEVEGGGLIGGRGWEGVQRLDGASAVVAVQDTQGLLNRPQRKRVCSLIRVQRARLSQQAWAPAEAELRIVCKNQSAAGEFS